MLDNRLPALSNSPRSLSADPRQGLAAMIADRVYRLLNNTTQLVPGRVAVYAIPRSDWVILIINPDAIRQMFVPDNFMQHLPRILGGRRVEVDRQTRTYIAVAYWPAPPVKLEALPLDLSEQMSPLHVPIGVTGRSGRTWLSIPEMDSVIVGGARRKGKTRFLHGWVMALIQGGRALLVLWDGKAGAEFGRYAGRPGVTVAEDLGQALTTVQQEVSQREILFRQRRVTSLPEHNRIPGIVPLPHIVLILDELADLPKGAEQALVQLVRRAGAYGVHPVVGIQRPDAEVMRGQLRANLVTRFALPVATRMDSQIILGRSGAEKMDKRPGRLLFEWDGRMIEAQSFQIELSDAPAYGQPVQPSHAAPSLLTERELRLVQAALELGGWFRVREIAMRVKESHRYVNDLAQRWELVGYLTPNQRNEQGHTLGRRVTDSLLRASGLGGFVDPDISVNSVVSDFSNPV